LSPERVPANAVKPHGGADGRCHASSARVAIGRGLGTRIGWPCCPKSGPAKENISGASPHCGRGPQNWPVAGLLCVNACAQGWSAREFRTTLEYEIPPPLVTPRRRAGRGFFRVCLLSED